ncbi:MAG: hypothetical protein HRT35_24330 [Algicola sp.]|nr:hypothetical protein [Algicola sp.]
MKEKQTSLKLSLFGGAGIGLLFGMLLGINTTPTIVTVIGSLTTLLAAMLGLNDAHFNNAKAVRLGAFGFVCVLGSCVGIFIRTHNLLSPSLMSLKSNYIALGYSERQALSFIGQTKGEQVAKQHSSMLFSANVSLTGCDELSLTDDSLPLDEIINNFKLTGGIWQKLMSNAIENIPPELQKKRLLAIKDSLCN